MKNIFSALCILSLAACSTVPLPSGSESAKAFTRESAKPYQETYRIIAKQMRACYRAIGLFGNGYDIQADLDTAVKHGTIELYSVGLTGAEKPEDSIFSRTVLVEASGAGSRITTSGTTPKYVYMTHMTIPVWLEGTTSCAPRQP